MTWWGLAQEKKWKVRWDANNNKNKNRFEMARLLRHFIVE
jgi:hypothetical protein